jgi:glycine betaine/choline ABC-type transport system substrate-binding protein
MESTFFMSLTRRNLIIRGAAAGAALTTMGLSPAAFAQDDKPTVRVGSKNYAEQLIVGQMITLLLEDAGFPIEQQMNLGGTIIAHEALVAGDLDTYVEYTGTGLIAVLGQDLPEASEASPSASPESGVVYDAAYEIVAREYPKQFGVEWLEPWGFNNTFAIIVTRQFADETGITKISELADAAGDMTFAADHEFAVRPDGLPGLEETYGFSFGDVQNVEIGLLYPSVANGDADVGVAASTDGRIPALDLVLLEDDMGFFPPYYAAPIVRQDLLEEAPEVRDILNQMAGQISNEQMQAMNYDVDEDGQEPVDVARQFLIDAGLIEG